MLSVFVQALSNLKNLILKFPKNDHAVRVFQLASNCKAEFQAYDSGRRCTENQLGSKRALGGDLKNWCLYCVAIKEKLSETTK